MTKKIAGLIGGLILFLFGIHLLGWTGVYAGMAPWQIALVLTLLFSGLFFMGFWLFKTFPKWFIGWILFLLGIILLSIWSLNVMVFTWSWLVVFAGVGCTMLGAFGTGVLFQKIISRKK